MKASRLRHTTTVSALSPSRMLKKAFPPERRDFGPSTRCSRCYPVPVRPRGFHRQCRPPDSGGTAANPTTRTPQRGSPRGRRCPDRRLLSTIRPPARAVPIRVEAGREPAGGVSPEETTRFAFLLAPHHGRSRLPGMAASVRPRRGPSARRGARGRRDGRRGRMAVDPYPAARLPAEGAGGFPPGETPHRSGGPRPGTTADGFPQSFSQQGGTP